jgi:DNA-directed RNA polymerase specialized sigma24 family protein
LVAIDADTTQERLNEIASENHIDLDTTISAAEDAAIIREALARLTSDQRTALVMWEMEGRTTEEIATALTQALQMFATSWFALASQWFAFLKIGLSMKRLA